MCILVEYRQIQPLKCSTWRKGEQVMHMNEYSLNIHLNVVCKVLWLVKLLYQNILMVFSWVIKFMLPPNLAHCYFWWKEAWIIVTLNPGPLLDPGPRGWSPHLTHPFVWTAACMDVPVSRYSYARWGGINILLQTVGCCSLYFHFPSTEYLGRRRLVERHLQREVWSVSS